MKQFKLLIRPHADPRVSKKIVINQGLGSATQDKKIIRRRSDALLIFFLELCWYSFDFLSGFFGDADELTLSVQLTTDARRLAGLGVNHIQVGNVNRGFRAHETALRILGVGLLAL